MTIDASYLDAKIAKTKELIERHEDAILKIVGGAQQYSLDTGQTRQMVTKANLATIRSALAELENRLEVLCSRRDGNAVVVRPGW